MFRLGWSICLTAYNSLLVFLMPMSDPFIIIIYWFVWFVVLFYGVSTLFGSFIARLSHFDKNFKQYSFLLFTQS